VKSSLVGRQYTNLEVGWIKTSDPAAELEAAERPFLKILIQL
jgi:hypothetical protein